jgi:hypothetical protein
MSLQTCENLHQVIQELKLQALVAWEPPHTDNTFTPTNMGQMIIELQETLSGVFDTVDINAAEQQLSQEEGKLPPTQFRIWNKGKAGRAAAAGAAQQAVAGEKLLRLMFQ